MSLPYQQHPTDGVDCLCGMSAPAVKANDISYLPARRLAITCVCIPVLIGGHAIGAIADDDDHAIQCRGKN